MASIVAVIAAWDNCPSRAARLHSNPATFGAYRFLTWLVAKRQAETGWKATRYLWPVAMLAAQWIVCPMTLRGRGGFAWLAAVLVSAPSWAFWYGVIRLLEWRNELAASTVLYLSASSRR